MGRKVVKTYTPEEVRPALEAIVSDGHAKGEAEAILRFTWSGEALTFSQYELSFASK